MNDGADSMVSAATEISVALSVNSIAWQPAGRATLFFAFSMTGDAMCIRMVPGGAPGRLRSRADYRRRGANAPRKTDAAPSENAHDTD